MLPVSEPTKIIYSHSFSPNTLFVFLLLRIRLSPIENPEYIKNNILELAINKIIDHNILPLPVCKIKFHRAASFIKG